MNRSLGRWVLVLIAGGAFGFGRAAEGKFPTSPLDEEETYELRLERVVNQKGTKALAEFLTKDVAERPTPWAKAWLANYLLYGVEFGLKDFANPVRGFGLAQESAKEGSLFGLELVGRAWGDGRGTPMRDSLEAVVKLQAAADRGRNSAMAELGKFYFFGDGVPQDRAEAEAWMRKAAWRGATAGLVNLARWWEEPKYVGTPDVAKALALYYEAGELGDAAARAVIQDRAKKGNRDAEKFAHLDFVVSAREGTDPLPAKLRTEVKWLEANCSPDDQPVQLALAEVMMDRRFVVFDAGAAIAKLARAAAAGNDDARAMQATMMWFGIGQKSDEAMAVAIWRELAEKGNARALNRIGWLHWWGNGEKFGVAKDPRQAFENCRRAADLGYWLAQRNVADCYADGIGVPLNYYLAAKYYGILDRRGFIPARRMKERILGYIKN